jgi:hypothetical protein
MKLTQYENWEFKSPDLGILALINFFVFFLTKNRDFIYEKCNYMKIDMNSDIF